MILGKKMSVVESRVGPANTPIQQLKAAGVTGRGQSTQGLPQPVSNISVAVTKSGTQRTLRVSFTQNPGDPYFTAAQVYVKQANGSPTLLASGPSPIIFSLPANNAPAILTVVSSGNWGSTPLVSSPGKVVSLA